MGGGAGTNDGLSQWVVFYLKRLTRFTLSEFKYELFEKKGAGFKMWTILRCASSITTFLATEWWIEWRDPNFR